MRGLFIDGFNSFWHVIFGIITYFFPYIIIFYTLYQYNNPNDENLIIDMIEYIFGLIIIIMIKKVKIKTI
jgi:hypothetical protein